jgi:hypothetical protein
VYVLSALHALLVLLVLLVLLLSPLRLIALRLHPARLLLALDPNSRTCAYPHVQEPLRVHGCLHIHEHPLHFHSTRATHPSLHPHTGVTHTHSHVRHSPELLLGVVSCHTACKVLLLSARPLLHVMHRPPWTKKGPRLLLLAH